MKHEDKEVSYITEFRFERIRYGPIKCHTHTFLTGRLKLKNTHIILDLFHHTHTVHILFDYCVSLASYMFHSFREKWASVIILSRPATGVCK